MFEQMEITSSLMTTNPHLEGELNIWRMLGGSHLRVQCTKHVQVNVSAQEGY